MSNFTIQQITTVEELKKGVPIFIAARNDWDEKWSEEKALDKLNYYFESPKFLGWLVFDGDQLVGMAVGNIEPYQVNEVFLLRGLYVPNASQLEEMTALIAKTILKYLYSNQVMMLEINTSISTLSVDYWLKQDFKYLPTKSGKYMMAFSNMV